MGRISTGKRRNGKAWVVAVDMGLGHQRAVFPLKSIAKKGAIINMQDDRYVCRKEAGVWRKTRTLYESVSRAGKIPFLGKYLLAAMDMIQFIPSYYPKRDLSAPTRAVKFLDNKIEKNDMGAQIVSIMHKSPAPLVTSFYAVAIAAEKQRYRGEIYCIICDSDFNRAWLPMNPQGSRIRYFSPCSHVTGRLQQYGVPRHMIHTTGFPLPKNNIGKNEEMTILKKDVRNRLHRLDPEGVFRGLHGATAAGYLDKPLRTGRSKSPLSIAFAVGGAGAQVDIGITLLSSLRKKMEQGEAELNLVAGVRPEVSATFHREIKKMGMDTLLGEAIHIIHHPELEGYFELFNALMRRTDLLWTKPSELTFYAGLGIPIVSAPPIGYHERLNYRWLVRKGAVIRQEDPRYTHQWLFDYRRNGLLADRAWNGFLKIRKLGTVRIEAVLRGDSAFADDPFIR